MKYRLAVLGVIGGLTLGVAAPGSAQLVPFQGTTQACFYYSPATTCTPVTSTPYVGNAYGAANINGGHLSTTVEDSKGVIWFTNGNFSFNVNAPGSQNFQLGLFSLNSKTPTTTFVNAFFVLAVNLTKPGTNSTVFHSLITGKLKGLVAQNGVGAISVNFNQGTGPGMNWTSPPIAFNGGTYTLTAHGGQYFSDEFNQPLIGTATVTPEPVTMTLFGTGLGGLALLRRRRKKKAQVQDA